MWPQWGSTGSSETCPSASGCCAMYNFPAIRAGTSRFTAILLACFVSAVFHELILGVPLHLVRLWAFCGIIFQV